MLFLVLNIILKTKNRKGNAMTIKIERLNPENREELRLLVKGRCLEKDCYAFAIALSRGLNWSIIGLIKGDVIYHAVLFGSDGMYWDARGPVTEDELGKPFGILPPYNLRPITEKELIATKPVSEIDIDSISRKAQAVWPELPWEKNTLKLRVLAFTADLERISRKHGLWIYGSTLGFLPAIAEGEGDEAGYRAKTNLDGSYTINRVIGE